MFQVRHISRSFGTVKANDDISLEVWPGEIVALLGENGAGKSTLLAVMGGYLLPDSGSLEMEGELLSLRTPGDAIRAGIGLVHQHLSLVPTFTVAEQLRLCGWNGDLLPEMIATIPLDTPIELLSMGERQRLEVAKALLAHPRLLLLDEPTSILAPTEVDTLQQMLRDLRESGLGIVLVTHKLPEVLAVADRMVILRHGQVSGAFARDAAGAWPEDIERRTLELMFGLEGGEPIDRVTAGSEALFDVPPEDVLLKVSNLSLMRSGRTALSGINLDVSAGEIVSIVGVDGQGQRELALSIAGYLRSTGRILLAGKRLDPLSAMDRARSGIGLLVDDRLGEAAIGSMSLAENVALKQPRPMAEANRGLMHWSVVRERTTAIIQQWGVTPANPGRSFGTLSGGNMQKLLAGRELDREPRVLLALNPMQGLDWQTTALLWNRFRQHCERGGAILVFTGDLEEALAHSDRVAAIAGGQLGELERVGRIDRRQLVRQMVGEW